LDSEESDVKKTNFDVFLEEQLLDPDFAERFKRAGAAWDVALQLAALREKEGLSQKELAKQLHTSQQQISRLESPAYEGHSLSMLRRVAHALNAEVKVSIEPTHKPAMVAESRAKYGKQS
jgi:ribosome-binding protein aMBF1 (putative translation factor)